MTDDHAISGLESQLRDAQSWCEIYTREAKRAAEEVTYKLDELAIQHKRIEDIEAALARLRAAGEAA